MLRPILLCALLGVVILGALKWREAASRRQAEASSGPTIIKQPVNFTNRTFDPLNPPPDMPPLNPTERAECDSDFLSHSNIGGETRRMDATHATVTVTQIKLILQLNVTIWVPVNASQHILEHEAGHRQISEAYYQGADTLARRIAASYMGKEMQISGTDLDAETNRVLQQVAEEINADYKMELNPEPTQLLYEAITDHGRNDVNAAEAASHAIKNIELEGPQSPGSN